MRSTAIASACFALIGAAQAQPHASAGGQARGEGWRQREEAKVRAALHLNEADLAVSAGAERPEVRIAFADLNGDGRPEALAYVRGEWTCGTSGCSLYVLTPQPGGYRIVGDMFGHLPVRLLRVRHHGWRDLTLVAAGGGILRAFEAAYSFNGRRYLGDNSANPPARRVPTGATGATIIPDR